MSQGYLTAPGRNAFKAPGIKSSVPATEKSATLGVKAMDSGQGNAPKKAVAGFDGGLKKAKV
jgi:hypothetical protein